MRKFHKYVRDSYKIGIFCNIIISLITVDKCKKVKAYHLYSGAVVGGAEIARPDKTAPDQTARLNNGGHEQRSP